MNKSILYGIMFLLVLSGCTVAYRTGQMPDDVYYAPPYYQPLPAAVPDSQEEDPGYQPLDTAYAPVYSLSDHPYQPGPLVYDTYTPWEDPFIYCPFTPYIGGFIYTHYFDNYYGSYYPYGGYYPYPVYTHPYTPASVYSLPPAYINPTPRMTNLSGYRSNYNNRNQSGTTNTIARPAATSAPPVSSVNNNGYRAAAARPQPAAPVYNNNNSNRPAFNNTPNNNYNDNAPRSYTPVYNDGGGSFGGNPGGGGGISRPARIGR